MKFCPEKTLELKPSQELTKDQEFQLKQILAELDYRRKINPIEFYEHLPQQLIFHNDLSKSKNLFGGNRSGKTEEVAEYIIQKCLSRPNQRWWACAESFPDSVNIQQRKVASMLPKRLIRYGRFDEVNGFTNRKLIFTNGSIIIFKSYDQGCASFAQDDCDGIWNDEEPPYDIHREQRMRLLDRDGEMIISMTSVKGVTNLIGDIFEDYTVVKSRYAPLLEEDLPTIAEKNGMRFYMLWTTDNPYIDQERVNAEIKMLTRDEIRSRIYGIPVNLSGKIYLRFTKDVHVIPFDKAPTKSVTLYHILDPHDRKPWAMKWIVMHSTGTAYCVDEYPNKNFNDMLGDDKTYDEYVNLIREKEDTLCDIFNCGVFKRIIDPNFGNKTIKLAERTDRSAHTTPKDELRKRGLRFKDGIDHLESGHLKVREMLHYESKDNEVIFQPKYFITDNCINSIRHLSRYSRKDIMTADGDMKDKVRVQEKYKDFCDLDRYFWMSNPRYIGQLKVFVPKAPKVY